MNYDKIISDLFFIDDWHISKSIRRKFLKKLKYNKCKNLNNYILNRFEDYDDYKEILYRIRHKLEERPVCKECGKRLHFVGKRGRFFQTYCSDKCRANSKENLEKIKQTNIKNWGTPGMYDSPKYQEKLLKEKGYKNYLQSDEFKNKRKQSLINHYGTLNIFDVPEIKNKIEQTCLERYGVKNTFLGEKCIKAKDEFYKTNAGKISSKPENETYELLKEKFSEVIRSYKSKEYPWRCDFYIPELKLYIECHYSQYHRRRPFNYEDKSCLEELEDLKQKSNQIKSETGVIKTQYDNMIYTWTNLDVRKRETAKKNNLNFMEFYSLDEAKAVLQNL